MTRLGTIRGEGGLLSVTPFSYSFSILSSRSVVVYKLVYPAATFTRGFWQAVRLGVLLPNPAIIRAYFTRTEKPSEG